MALMQGTLLERADEITALDHLIATAGDGQGAACVVEGPAGIGKSVLLTSAEARAREGGMVVLQARASPLERDYPFGVAQEMLTDAVTRTPNGSALYEGSGERAREVLEATDGAPPAATGLEPGFAIVRALAVVVTRLAERSPVLISVDDAQWSDELSLRLVHFLAHRAGELGLAVVAGVRTGEPMATNGTLSELLALPDALVLRPAPLSREAAATLVRDALPEAADEFVVACHRAAAGNPYYLRALVRAAEADAMTPDADAAKRVEKLGAAAVGRTVFARVARLGRPARELAAAVAVGDEDLSLAQAGAIAELESDAAREALDALARAELLAPGEPLSFAHPIVREAIYGDLPPGARAELHLRAASELRGTGNLDRVAAQLMRSPRRAADWAAATLREAAARAADRGAPEIAVRYLERALEEEPPPEERGPILIELGLCSSDSGHPEGARRILEGAELVSDPGERGMALLKYAGLLGTRGRYGDAARLCLRAKAEMEDLPGEGPELIVGLADGWSALSGAHDRELRADSVARTARMAAEIDRPVNPLERSILAFEGLQRIYTAEPAAAAAEIAARAVEGWRAEDEGADLAFNVAANVLCICDDFDTSAIAIAALEARAAREGSAVAEAAVRHVQAMTAMQRGDVGLLRARSEVAIEGFEQGWGVSLPLAYALLTQAHIERGELEEAEETLRASGGGDRWDGDFFEFYLLEAEGHLRLEAGEADAAYERFRQAGDQLEAVGIVNPALSHLPWRSGAALAAARLGRQEAAGELAGEELAIARRFGVERTIGIALRAAGLAAEGQRRIDLLEESAGALEGSSSRLELARSLVELGAALRRARRRKDAREPLRRGLELARECGAIALAERAHGELQATGARPRSLVFSGVEALTPSEHRVASLAAEGLNNPQIAERLFLSRKTVEAHLGSVYRKLEISSRGELPDALVA